MKVFAALSGAHDWLAWICQTIIKWIFKQWFTRMAISIVICNMLYCLFAFSDIVSGSARLCRHAKFTAKQCVKRGKRLPYLCCVYTTVCASYVIQFTRAAIIGTVDGLASTYGNVFYDLIVDPLSRLTSDCSCHGDDRTAHRRAASPLLHL